MKKYKSYKGEVGKKAPNILNRCFQAEKPNQKWVTGITEFKLFGQKLYLSPILDLFNGEIITYKLHTRPTFDLVKTMLIEGIQHLNENDELLLHSDQGWHYRRMPQYQKILKEPSHYSKHVSKRKLLRQRRYRKLLRNNEIRISVLTTIRPLQERIYYNHLRNQD